MQDLPVRQTSHAIQTSETLSKRSGRIWTGKAAALYNVSDSSHGLFRKEVIQPQVLLRLPCYDFTPIMNHTLGRCLPCGSACRLLVQSTFVM